jgi:Protein of unknown function (DUF2442)
MSQYPRLIAAEHLEQYSLRVTFEDGRVGILDLSEELWGDYRSALRDPAIFEQFYIDGGILAWDNGAEFEGDELYHQLNQIN